MTPLLYDYELDDGCYAVRLGASLMGIAIDRVAVDVWPGAEHKGPAFLALNPAGRLPVLKHGNLVVAHPGAILLYLARTYRSGSTWIPAEPGQLAAVDSWLHFAARDLVAAGSARAAALFGLPIDRATDTAAARRAFRIMDDHMTRRGLSGAAWFAGHGPSVADVGLFPAFGLCRDFGLDHDEFPALRRWIRQLRSLPGFKTMPGIPDYH